MHGYSGNADMASSNRYHGISLVAIKDLYTERSIERMQAGL